MIALLQRVSKASVTVNHHITGKIGSGLLVFLCAEHRDTKKEADALLNKLVNYRVFYDENGKMNLSLASIHGELLLVPQFTLAANTKSGTRPSFSSAASPETGKQLFDYFVAQARTKIAKVDMGTFGEHMEVALVNDGPVTFWLQVPPDSEKSV